MRQVLRGAHTPIAALCLRVRLRRGLEPEAASCSQVSFTAGVVVGWTLNRWARKTFIKAVKRIEGGAGGHTGVFFFFHLKEAPPTLPAVLCSCVHQTPCGRQGSCEQCPPG